MALSERREHILRLIVSEYIKEAIPVGSEALARRAALPLSAATIRNEMAVLEQEGYITHPHTSAGRIPSDKGYRYYVEALMEEEKLPESQQRTIRHQFHQAEWELEGWLQLAASVLAGLAHNVALVAPPRTARTVAQWLHLVYIHDPLALLVMVLGGARIRQSLFPLDRPHTQDDLDIAAQRLNRLLVGRTAYQLRGLAVELSPLEEQVRQRVVESLEAEDAARNDATYLDGLRQLLAQPEFRRPESVLDALEVLDEHRLARAIPLLAIASGGGVCIVIGGEQPRDALRSYSLVASRYGLAGGPEGAVAVLGPTRMPYDRTVPVVRYVASLLSELIAHYS